MSHWNKLLYFVSSLLVLGLPLQVLGETRIGWVEKVMILPYGLELPAKMDTGADNSSLHCDCDFFRRDGSTWVRFLLEQEGKRVQIEEPVLRYTRIKRHGGQIQKRAVVELNLCIAGYMKKAEVSLVDRRGFNYKLLVGRSFLRGEFIVDPDKKHMVTNMCGES